MDFLRNAHSLVFGCKCSLFIKLLACMVEDFQQEGFLKELAPEAYAPYPVFNSMDIRLNTIVFFLRLHLINSL